jgi:hypothetical protein
LIIKVKLSLLESAIWAEFVINKRRNIGEEQRGEKAFVFSTSLVNILSNI